MCIVRPDPSQPFPADTFLSGYNSNLHDEENKMKADYNHAKINFENGLLEIAFHTDGGPLFWSGAVHDELAAELLTKNPLMLRYTRNLLVHQIKTTVHELLGYGLALEGLAVVDQGLKIRQDD